MRIDSFFWKIVFVLLLLFDLSVGLANMYNQYSDGVLSIYTGNGRTNKYVRDKDTTPTLQCKKSESTILLRLIQFAFYLISVRYRECIDYSCPSLPHPYRGSRVTVSARLDKRTRDFSMARQWYSVLLCLVPIIITIIYQFLIISNIIVDGVDWISCLSKFIGVSCL